MRKGCLWILVPVIALVIYTWPEVYRYRITVEVETPEGLRTGSSVIQTKSRRVIRILPNMHISSGSMRGEAVMVDLPHGQTLFMLISSVGYFLQEAQKVPDFNSRKAPAVTVSGRFPNYPVLVRFRDLSVPASVERVDPNNLAASLGPNVKLRRITVQRTIEPVTTGIRKRLPWLPEYYDKMLDGNRLNSSPELASGLSSGSFEQGN